jgi:hypothetical protein
MSLCEQFDVLGYWGDEIYFSLNDRVIMIKDKLPKSEMILKLKVEPEDVKSLRDEILVDASKKPLTYEQRNDLNKGR